MPDTSKASTKAIRLLQSVPVVDTSTRFHSLLTLHALQPLIDREEQCQPRQTCIYLSTTPPPPSSYECHEQEITESGLRFEAQVLHQRLEPPVTASVRHRESDDRRTPPSAAAAAAATAYLQPSAAQSTDESESAGTAAQLHLPSRRRSLGSQRSTSRPVQLADGAPRSGHGARAAAVAGHERPAADQHRGRSGLSAPGASDGGGGSAPAGWGASSVRGLPSSGRSACRSARGPVRQRSSVRVRGRRSRPEQSAADRGHRLCAYRRAFSSGVEACSDTMQRCRERPSLASHSPLSRTTRPRKTSSPSGQEPGIRPSRRSARTCPFPTHREHRELTAHQIPTVLYYDQYQKVVGWGPDIADALAPTGYPKPGVQKVEWFKLQLMLSGNTYIDPINLPPLPPGKSEIDVAADYLAKLRQAMRNQLQKTLGEVFQREERNIRYYLTVPAIWNDAGKAATRAAAIQAGFVRDVNDNRLTLITEPEAAAMFCSKTGLLDLKVHDAVLIVDCGGGTVDLIAYEVEEEQPFTVAECTAGSGDSCGSTALNRNFSNILRAKIRKMKLPEGSKTAGKVYAKCIMDFENRIKADFRNNGQKWAVDVGIEAEFPEAGIVEGYMTFTNEEILQCFEPVVNRILELVRNQIIAIQAQNRTLQVKGRPRAFFGPRPPSSALADVEARTCSSSADSARPSTCSSRSSCTCLLSTRPRWSDPWIRWRRSSRAR